MKKRKVLSLLLSVLLMAALLPGALTAEAAGPADGNQSGMVLNKTSEANPDGSFTVSLEAYATGDSLMTQQQKPVDIVLVLDQSGSMDDDMVSLEFSLYNKASNKEYYQYRHNGGSKNLYYKLGDNSYVQVSVAIKEYGGYSQIDQKTTNEDYYYNNRENLYAKINGEYQKVKVARESKRIDHKWVRFYTYTLENGTVIGSGKKDANTPAFTGIEGNVLYTKGADPSLTEYTYSYTDAEGNVQILETSAGEDTQCNTRFYKQSSGGTDSRLSVLQGALRSFVNEVSTKAAGADGLLGTADDVNHRIAIVGFAGGKNSSSEYKNSELFVGSEQYNYKYLGLRESKNSRDADQLKNAFRSMDTALGRENVEASIGALRAEGATNTHYGTEMAMAVLKENPLPPGEERNRVVIVFTDGAPNYSNGFKLAVADQAIADAQTLKNSGATVYGVGVFPGADGSSAGKRPGGDLDSDDFPEEGTEKGINACNWFMQNLSSNNGTPRTPSYYLSAANASDLYSIFGKISGNIESGGTSVTLDSETVIKDIITPYFKLPDGTTAADITLESYSYDGPDSWIQNPDAMGAVAKVDGSSNVSVTGFDFAENYVGTHTDIDGTVSYKGHKLRISFPVWPKDGFLGGNNVDTNTSAYIYENAAAEKPVLEYERPKVNVPIKAITAVAPDKNVYLLSDLTAAQIREGCTVAVGGVHLNLDPTVPNFGLEPWQNEFVDISVTYADANGNEVTDLSGLREDSKYSLSVTVSPKSDIASTEGEKAVTQTGRAEGRINVFKPELHFRDSVVWYGGTAPTDENYESLNYANVYWKHGETLADKDKMGLPPELSVICTPETGAIKNGLVNTKNDIPVAAQVKLGNEDIMAESNFVHEACGEPGCSWQDPALKGDPAFLLHVRTCKLTVTKTGGTEGEPYVFKVLKDGRPYTELTIVGNGSKTVMELPVGEYSVKEDEGWSWRFRPAIGDPVALSSTNPEGSIQCKNTKEDDHWLNGFTDVVTNTWTKPVV